jgi:hypothetical protein
MTEIHTLHPLLDSPLMDAPTRRQLLVERMAADLVKYDAAQNEADAIRCLVFGCGYFSGDVMMLVDDARALAFQDIVAKEMTRS